MRKYFCVAVGAAGAAVECGSWYRTCYIVLGPGPWRLGRGCVVPVSKAVGLGVPCGCGPEAGQRAVWCLWGAVRCRAVGVSGVGAGRVHVCVAYV